MSNETVDFTTHYFVLEESDETISSLLKQKIASHAAAGPIVGFRLPRKDEPLVEFRIDLKKSTSKTAEMVITECIESLQCDLTNLEQSFLSSLNNTKPQTNVSNEYQKKKTRHTN